MSKSSHIRERRLEVPDAEFRSLAISCLKECAEGRWGLFGQNDHLDPKGSKFSHWPEARRVGEIALEIQAIRSEFGGANWFCDRFLYFCSLRGSNVLGEPKLATQLIEEFESHRD
jgi:hypothetical protein